MEKISITRALGELKLLDSRINKEIGRSVFVGLYNNRKDQIIGVNVSKQDFEKKALSSEQSINALIERRDKIKCQILLSNAKTMVKIGSKEYYVIEAIEKKRSIVYVELLLAKYKKNHVSGLTQIEQNNVNLKAQVDKMVETNYGTDKQPGKSDYDNISKPIYEQNELKMCDPIGIADKIEKLDKEIDEFLSEVDFVLSESNSRTEIEV